MKRVIFVMEVVVSDEIFNSDIKEMMQEVKSGQFQKELEENGIKVKYISFEEIKS